MHFPIVPSTYNDIKISGQPEKCSSQKSVFPVSNGGHPKQEKTSKKQKQIVSRLRQEIQSIIHMFYNISTKLYSRLIGRHPTEHGITPVGFLAMLCTIV